MNSTIAKQVESTNAQRPNDSIITVTIYFQAEKN